MMVLGDRRGVRIGGAEEFADTSSNKRTKPSLHGGQAGTPVCGDAQIAVRSPEKAGRMIQEQPNRNFMRRPERVMGFKRASQLEDSQRFAAGVANGSAADSNEQAGAVLMHALAKLERWACVRAVRRQKRFELGQFLGRQQALQRLPDHFRRRVAVEARGTGAPGFDGAFGGHADYSVFRRLQNSSEQIVAGWAMGHESPSIFQNGEDVRVKGAFLQARGGLQASLAMRAFSHQLEAV